MEKSDVYKCESCETIVTILKTGKSEGKLSCCDKMMIDVTPDEGRRIAQQVDMARPGGP